jgi:hypothetical protein
VSLIEVVCADAVELSVARHPARLAARTLESAFVLCWLTLLGERVGRIPSSIGSPRANYDQEL